eukprot:TRINITY_DN1652_c0_g1_i6.p1 TRINITY_DN1652_c0_g1~~TRINITY_DN1652_c0_g1_i6.p1  ORF type:complete len:225 (+),score=43.34 TRINITY_DN1652_c0_g1_i6:120-794(+)
MGSRLQHLRDTGWEVFCSIQHKMKFLVVLLSVALVYCSADPSRGSYGSGSHCHDKKEQHCNKVPKQEEHEECEIDWEIEVEVTYVETCEFVVITHCEEDHEQVYHNSHIIKGDSQVVDVSHKDYHGDYHKRSADPGHSTGHKCKDKKQKECHKHPDANILRIPKTNCKKVVDTIYYEECEDIISTRCEESHDQYHHTSNVAGQDSRKVDHSSHYDHHRSYGSKH